MSSFTRRGFFGLAAGGLVAACGSSGSSGSGSSPGDEATAAALVSYFPDGIYLAGRKERLPFGLADADGVPLSAGPERLEATVMSASGEKVAALTASRRVEGLPRAYYSFEMELAQPGIYSLEAKVNGQTLEQLFTIGVPGSLSFPGAGEPLEPFDTPTTTDSRGVTPLCTRPEPCPFHELTLTEALAAGRPVAYLVGTPAHCQTAICGPVLDLLIAAAPGFPQFSFVHAEVYADEAAKEIAPAVAQLGLQFEPLLFVVGADGIVQRRLDVIYDRNELEMALSAAIS